MIPEAPPEQTEVGPVGAAERVVHRLDGVRGDTYFPQLGVNLAVLSPGEPSSMYHWETETEALLVLSGEAL